MKDIFTVKDMTAEDTRLSVQMYDNKRAGVSFFQMTINQTDCPGLSIDLSENEMEDFISAFEKAVGRKSQYDMGEALGNMIASTIW